MRKQTKFAVNGGKFVISKEEGKDEESIQSNTTPDIGQHIGK